MSLSLKKWTSGKSILFVGGSASPFIDKGSGFTGEGESTDVSKSYCPRRMRVVMMVGTHNTVDVAVEYQVHMGVALASS